MKIGSKTGEASLLLNNRGEWISKADFEKKFQNYKAWAANYDNEFALAFSRGHAAAIKCISNFIAGMKRIDQIYLAPLLSEI